MIGTSGKRLERKKILLTVKLKRHFLLLLLVCSNDWA